MQTDYRLRGYSVSDGHAVGTLSVGYDDPTGFYFGGAAGGTIDHGDPELVLLEEHAGYALRLTPDVSVDAGISHSQYHSIFGTTRYRQYTEVYLGAGIRRVSARLSYSPNYYSAHTPTLYAELNGGIEPAPNWFLSAHAGALMYLKDAPYDLPDKRYDWRFTASRQLGRYGVHLSVSGRLQGEDSAFATDKAAIVASVTRAF